MSGLQLSAGGKFFTGAGIQAINAIAGRGVAVLLLILFFYYASLLFWQVFYPEGFRLLVPTVDGAAATKFAGARGSWDWFADTQATQQEASPPSRLDASLIGVIAVSQESGKGMAFINYKGKDNIYKVGDEITPAVVLHEIAVAHVTLQRDGRFERLEIKKSESLFGDDAAAAETAGDGNGLVGAAEVSAQEPLDLPEDIAGARQFRELLRENPAQLLSLFSFERVEVNGRTGFNLSAKRDDGQKILDSMGWQQDDVVMSVNGAPVSQVASNSRLWKSLLKAGKIKFKVFRDGDEVNLSI